MKCSTACIMVGLIGVAGVGIAPAAAQTTVGIAASGITFTPANVTIEVGDSVQWTGLLGGGHTVAEVDDSAALVWNSGFHSAALASEFTHTFTAAGTYYYICEPHSAFGMRGTVTVNEPPVIPAVSQWGMAAFALLVIIAGTVVCGRLQTVRA